MTAAWDGTKIAAMPRTADRTHIILATAILAMLVSCVTMERDDPPTVEITLRSPITSYMVLQRGVTVPIGGMAQPGKTVVVRFAGMEKTAVADASGSWSAALDPMEASSEGREMTVDYAAKDSGFALTLTDVLVGEVWFCSGQSNMELGMGAMADRLNELKDGNYPRIRLFPISKSASPFPEEKVPSIWWECSRQNLISGGWNGFSAVAFMFGRKLHKELDVPIGLIQSAYGGSPAYPWIPPEELAAEPALRKYKSLLDSANKNYEEQKKSDPEARHPFADITDYSRLRPTVLYNAMVAPIAPYPIRGALWYQGESDIDKSSVYPETMRALISGWRRVFNAGDFPFYFVQLPPYGYGAEGLLPAMWEAQEECLSIPNTGMVTTVDVGNPKDIHPARKREVGDRLALLALARTYGLGGIAYSGPVYRGMTLSGDAAVIKFDHAAGGLVAKDDKPLTWFTIAGEDMKFHPARAVIDGSTVIVRSDSVKTPAAVRFAWSNLAEPNLYNAEGLPAWPFRTDGAKAP